MLFSLIILKAESVNLVNPCQSKLLKLKINYKNSIIENLFSIIELERSLKSSKFIVLVNLKQYLDDNELKELYKYIYKYENFLSLRNDLINLIEYK